MVFSHCIIRVGRAGVPQNNKAGISGLTASARSGRRALIDMFDADQFVINALLNK
jgi:hypothetical protein